MRDQTGSASDWKLEVCLLAGVTIFAYLLLFKLPFYPFFYEADQLIFLYNADRMMAGDAMYRDFFQFTFPGGQVLYYLLFSIFGQHYWVLPSAIIAMSTATFWLLLKISKGLISGPLAYLPPLLFIFFGLRWFGLDGSHRMFSPLFVLLGIWALLKGRTAAHLACAGTMCAFTSYFTQQRGFVAVAAFGFFLLVDNFLAGRRWNELWRSGIFLVGSFVICLLILCLPFIAVSGWDTFYWSTIVYPASYYSFHEQNSFFGFVAGFRDLLAIPGLGKFAAVFPAFFYAVVVPLTPILFLLVFAYKREKFEWAYWRGPMLLSVVALFGLLTTTNPSHLRYFQLATPSLVLLAWLVNHWKLFAQRVNQVVAFVAASLMLFGAFQAFRVQTAWEYVRIDAPRGTVYALPNGQIGRYIWINENTKPGDPVFETTNPYIYFLFGLRNPSRFTQIYPTDYTRPEFVAGVIDDFSKDPPKFILWEDSYNKPDAERPVGDHTGPLSDYVMQHYAPTGEVYSVDYKPVQIWQLKRPDQIP